MTRALLVEDNAKFRQTIRMVLSTFFPTASVDEASNAKEAMEKLESFHPEVILMDIKLPGENGLKLTRRIKYFYPHIIIVVLTTYDFPEYREAALQAGANYFLTKGSATGEEIAELLQSVSPVNPSSVREESASPKVKVQSRLVPAT